jgi:undecaprenyl-diphosphatase
VDYFQSIIIGIIEGFTEFLPISSTGHMIVAGHFLDIPQSELIKAFEVIIQFAAILAVMIIYRDKITIKKMDLWIKLFIAFLPLAIVGFIFKDAIKELFSIKVVAIMFIVGGVAFLIVEYLYKENRAYTRDVEDVTMKQSLVIGLFQILSLIPGTSRAGSTIIGGLLSGLDRKASSEFSFLLAIPVMGAVSGYDLLKHYEQFANAQWGVYAVGFVTAFVVAFITIKLFLAFLSRFTFVPFGIYRIAFGLFLLSYF